jgi:hypothetical protein
MNIITEIITAHINLRLLSITIARYMNIGNMISNRLGIFTSGRNMSGHVTDRLIIARTTE